MGYGLSKAHPSFSFSVCCLWTRCKLSPTTPPHPMPSCLLPCFSPWYSLANPLDCEQAPSQLFSFLWVVLVMMSLHNNTTVSKSGYVNNLSVTVTKYRSNTMPPEERLILDQSFWGFSHEWLYPWIWGPTEAAHSNGSTYWGSRELSPGGRKWQW